MGLWKADAQETTCAQLDDMFPPLPKEPDSAQRKNAKHENDAEMNDAKNVMDVVVSAFQDGARAREQ